MKSAYKVAVQRRENELGRDATSSDPTRVGDSAFRWDKIWSMGVPNKVRMFMWRLDHNSLALRRNLIRRGMKEDPLCPMCCRLDEDPGHLFFKCKHVKECWRGLNMEYRLVLSHCQSGQDMMLKIWSFPSQIQVQIVVLLWKWWSVRNKVNAGERRFTGPVVCSLVSFYVAEFQKEQKTTNRAESSKKKWEPPPEDMYKINIDGYFNLGTGKGVGASLLGTLLVNS